MTKRLSLLVALVAGLVLLSGCLDAAALENAPKPDIDTDGATTVTTPNGADPDPVPLPTVPSEFNEATVGEFAAAFEEARMHNELVSKNSDVVRLGITCDVETVDPVDDTYAVTVSCGHWYEFQTGDTIGIADGAPYAVTHVVSDGGIERTGNREFLTMA